jgi:hypothetical protein
MAVGLGRVTGRSTRAGLLAAAAGVVFGLTAAVTASFVRSLRQEGVDSILAHWQPWALITLGIAGIALSTGAFQASPPAPTRPELAGPYRIRPRDGGCDVLEAGRPATTAEARPEPERADRLRSTSCP